MNRIDHEKFQEKDKAWDEYKKAIESHRQAHEAYYAYIDSGKNDNKQREKLEKKYISTYDYMIETGDKWRSINIMMHKQT